MARTVKLYIYEDGFYHECKFDGSFTNTYRIDSDNFICSFCNIKIPKFLTTSFNINSTPTEHYISIGIWKLGMYIQDDSTIKDFEAKRKELEFEEI